MSPDNQANTPDTPVQSLPVQAQQDNNLVSRKHNFNILAIIGVLMLVLVVGLGSYMLGIRKRQSDLTTQIEYPSPTPVQEMPTSKVTSPTGVPTTVAVALPSGWNYKNNAECGVKFAIPPKARPYFTPSDPNRPPSVTNDIESSRFWDFPRGGVYPKMLSKLMGDKKYKQAVTMFAAPEEASGYLASAVVVSCIPNSTNLTSDKMLESLKSRLADFNSDTGEKGMQASSYIIQSSDKANRWNNEVYDINVLEDNSSVDYTMFATPAYVYEVRVMGASTDSFVQETAQRIFENLVFEE